MNRERRQKTSTGLIYIVVVMVFVVAVLSVQMVTLYKKNESYSLQEEALLAELKTERQRTDELAALEQYIGTQGYIEDTAKSKLGLIYDNEVIFREK